MMSTNLDIITLVVCFFALDSETAERISMKLGIYSRNNIRTAFYKDIPQAKP